MENSIICKCKNVSYFDVEDALRSTDNVPDLVGRFAEVQAITHCTTGCGGCYDKILDAISEIVYK